MKTTLRRLVLLALGSMWAVGAFAQPADWSLNCISPTNDQPYSDPYTLQILSNDLMTFTVGDEGTVAYGGEGGPCFDGQQSIPNTGKFAYSIGPVGSIQRSSANFNDDFMTLTVGAPINPMWCAANIIVDGTKAFFPNGWGDFFVGLSNRYFTGTSEVSGMFIRLNAELVADSVRMRWAITNNSGATADVALIWGAALGMLTNGDNRSENFANQAHWDIGGTITDEITPGYIYIPGRKPPIGTLAMDRDTDPATFPDYINFTFSQTDAYGLRIDNTASEDTKDVRLENNPTDADRVVISWNTDIMGQIDDAAPIIDDSDPEPELSFLGETAFCQRFEPQPLPAGSTRTILYYVRGTWGVGSYALPYAAVVDAPKVVQNREVDFSGSPAQGQLVPNPFTTRVWVDNVGGFGEIGKEVPLTDVQIKLTFEPGLGISLIGSNLKSIATVPARELRFTEFQAEVDEDAVGDVPYTVEIFSQPGNIRKTIKGIVHVAGRPRLGLRQDANLVGVPYKFSDTSWDAVLGNFEDPTISGADAQVFEYDPLQQGYVLSTSVKRGVGAFIVYDRPGSTAVTRANLTGNPVRPSPSGDAPLTQLRRGWNLIANPYNYRMPLSQIVGVPDDPNNERALTFKEMVDLGIVSNFVAYFNPDTDEYEFTDGTDGMLEPNRGYWLLVTGSDEVSLSYPELFAEFVPNSTRSRSGTRQTEALGGGWKLNLVARTETSLDSQNFIGVLGTPGKAATMRIVEPPMFPNQQLALSVEELLDGKATRVAQSFQEQASRMEWKVVADVRAAGRVSLSWPNLSAAPKNLRFRLIDVATGATRDLRQSSSYSFRADQPGTREFRIEVTPGSESRAVIGNVVVSRPSRAPSAPFTIAYTLSTDATTSVRVLSASGREVFTVTRGRADRAGENTVSWALRDNANRAVAPGTYRVEIVAETATGERVRKIVPVNVIR